MISVVLVRVGGVDVGTAVEQGTADRIHSDGCWFPCFGRRLLESITPRCARRVVDTVTRIIRSMSMSEPAAGVLRPFQTEVATVLISGNKRG